MKAEETNIKSIIEGTKQYIIPLYQRAYVWDKTNWQTFWDDLTDLCSDEHNENHFFGSFVTMPSEIDSDSEIDNFFLIDGQQRLTTIFILLATLRDKAQEASDKELQEAIEDKYLWNRHNDKALKLLPTKLQGDQDCFDQIIRGGNDASRTSNNRIKECSVFFSKALAQTDIESKTLRRNITNGLRVVHIKLEKDDDPYKIFESLNAKGAELSQADLIRNHFFMRLNDDLEENYKRYWEPMQEKLGDHLSEYMRHYLMKYGTKIKKNEVYSTLKKLIDEKNREEVVKLLKKLAKFAGYYEKLLFPNRETDSKIREALYSLNQMEFTIAYPFLLKIYDGYENDKSIDSLDKFIEILNLLENVSVHRSIFKMRTSTRFNAIFYSLCKKQSKPDNFVVEYMKIEFSKQQSSSTIQFIETFKTTVLYAGRNKERKTKFILGRLTSCENQEPVNVEGKDITIEHIMPQKLTPEWRKYLGKHHQRIHETHVHTIGNLTLSGVNQKLGQLEFSKKQEILKNSNLLLNRYFADLTRWDEDAIRQRADYLAKQALKIWPDFGKVVQTLQIDSNLLKDDIKGKKPLTLIILDESHSVSSWRAVMHTTLETLMTLSDFDQIIKEFPKYFAREPKSSYSHKLSDGVYIEASMSAWNIYLFCCRVATLSGLVGDDWQVEFI